MPRPASRLVWLRYAIAVVVCLGMGALLSWPAFEMLWLSGSDEDFVSRQNRLDQIQWIQTVLIAGFLYTWFFFFGATVGSFLNVVIWRMPRGETVVTRPSRCPFCSTKLAWNDNVPVLGWLMLGGRCRTCRLPISPRYPLVEAAMGLIFLVLLQTEVLQGGSNLPGHAAIALSYARAMLELKFEMLSIYAFHCYFFSLMMCWALIAWDRSRMPLTLNVVAYGVGFFAPLIWPELYPVAWSDSTFDSFHDAARLSVFLTAICGIVAGTIGGAVLRLALPKPERTDASHRLGIPIMLVAVGLYFGWQAVLAVAAMSLAIAILLTPLQKARQRVDFAGSLEIALLVASVVFVLSWKFWIATVGLGQLIPNCVVLAVSVLLWFILRKLTWQAEVDLARFQRPLGEKSATSPDLQLLASSGTISENTH
ncbi:prepilin peptidase [Bremerella cremea]|uniref:A24 family peptidase n=1 Tax=Bremerella cremea TaxID=1031537 RepID=UPI0031E8A4F1